MPGASGEADSAAAGDGGGGRRGDVGHPTTRSTPRFSRARAMITRWISEVPSQIRSTRSSRRNRSGANSRMYPRPPKTWTTRSAHRQAASDANSLASDALAWSDLGVRARIGEPGRLPREQASRRGIRGGIGEREGHTLEVVDPLAELDALGGPRHGQLEQSLHGPRTPGADVDALLDEPLVRQLVRRSDRTQDGRGRDPDIGQDELRVPVGEGVGVVGVVLHDDARRVVVHQEQRRQALVAIDDDRVEDHEVGVVGAGDEPLLPVEHVLAGRGVADRRRCEGPGIGSGTVFRDRIRARPFAAQARVEIPGALLGRAVDQRVVGARDERPQPAGGLPELLMDQHLLEDRPALATKLVWERATLKARVERRTPDLHAPRPGDATTETLELRLAGSEDVFDESAGSRLERKLVGCKGQIHCARRMRHAATRPRPPSRAARHQPRVGAYGTWPKRRTGTGTNVGKHIPAI